MLSPEEIITEVALLSGVPAPAITGSRRATPITRARFLAIAAVREAYSDWPLQAVGHLFNRCHGTIANALIRHSTLLKTDRRYHYLAKQVCRSIFYGPFTSR